MRFCSVLFFLVALCKSSQRFRSAVMETLSSPRALNNAAEVQNHDRQLKNPPGP